MKKLILCIVLFLGFSAHAEEKAYIIKCDAQHVNSDFKTIDLPTVKSGADLRLEIALPDVFKQNVFFVEANMIGGNKTPHGLQLATKTSDGTIVINNGTKSVSTTLKVNNDFARITCRLELEK
jgi:hypothetical protein